MSLNRINLDSSFSIGNSNAAAVGNNGEKFMVNLRGQTPAAHAAAILEHYDFTKADETKFKELFGYDLRQHFTDSYSRHDNRTAHVALGNGLYKAEIVIPKELAAQIRAVKSANQQPSTLPPRSIDQTIAERKGYDATAVLRAQIESRLPNNTPLSSVPVPEPAPVPLPDKSKYIGVNKVELPTTPENADKLTVTVQTFIPFAHVDGPNNPLMTPLAPALGNFEGDGRDVDQRTVIKDGKQVESTYRTKQVIDVDFNMPEGVDFPCQSSGQDGVSRDLSRWDNETPLRRDKASGATIQATARREGNEITIEAKEDESNPLVYGAPSISYNLKIKIEKQSNGTMKMTTSGLHDGFPGYEMFVSRPNANEADKKLIYGFDPRTVGNTPLALAGEIFGQQVISTQTVIAPTAISNQQTERK